AHRGDTGLELFQREKPDVVLLDLNLPGMDGLDVARAIRRAGDTPIIMITARVDEADQLVGLELGADDYVTKPFSPRVLVARVRALLRRAQAAPTPRRIRVDDIEIDLDAHTVTRAGEPIHLTPTEFRLLVALARQPGRAFTREQLLQAIQDSPFVGYERTVDAHIKNLRAKLEPDPKHPRYIETVFGVGYRFRRPES
ncbi:MAG: response regulator transcription factor, partial [Chloroflexi bacterium]|nr:response regulator transcription factor [Chloroflexota bacterium]